MFRATMCPSSGENTVPMRHLLFVTLYRWLSGIQGGMKCAHNQEIPYLCDTWYLSLYIDNCLVCRAEWNSVSFRSCRQPQTSVTPEAAITVFELLMMGGVSLETFWAIKKHWNNKFYYRVASCWLFL